MLNSRTKKLARNSTQELLLTSDSDDVFVDCDTEKAIHSSNKKSAKLKTNKKTEFKKITKEGMGAESEQCISRKITLEEIERENHILQKAENDLKELKIKVEEKEIIFEKLLLELKRMAYVFNKVREIDISTAGKEFSDESMVGFINIRRGTVLLCDSFMHSIISTRKTLSKMLFLFKDGRLTIEQRKELVEKGPFNLIFHGVVPDWIEMHELVDDDPEFMRDIIVQRIRSLIRDEVNYNMVVLGYVAF